MMDRIVGAAGPFAYNIIGLLLGSRQIIAEFAGSPGCATGTSWTKSGTRRGREAWRGRRNVMGNDPLIVLRSYKREINFSSRLKSYRGTAGTLRCNM